MRESEPAQMTVRVRKTWPALYSEEHVLPRSRLYDLVPYEVRTPWCESLTGYINRLGWTHHIPPRALVAQEIVPLLDERKRLAAPVAVFGTKLAMSLNGAGVATKPWIEVLSHLTSREELSFLTLPLWIGNLTSRWQLRETPAWCPSCISDWKTNRQSLYQPLHWMLRVVTLCPRHQVPLLDHCPHCQKCQLIFASSKTQPGECTSCGHGLWNDRQPLSQEVNEEHRAWQGWVWKILQELQATGAHTGTVLWDTFFRQLASYLQEQKGYSRLAQATGIDRTVLYRWINPADTYSPTLEAILKLCYVCQITPFQVMNGQLDQLQQTLHTGTERRSPLPHRQNQRFDLERCQMALQAALDSNNEPRSLRQIAQQLGYEDAHQLVYHFPEECKLVMLRAQAYRQQRKAQRLVQVGEQVRQAVFSVHSQGFYPSHRRLRTLLPSALMRQPEAKEAWRIALQELGYEL